MYDDIADDDLDLFDGELTVCVIIILLQHCLDFGRHFARMLVLVHDISHTGMEVIHGGSNRCFQEIVERCFCEDIKFAVCLRDRRRLLGDTFEQSDFAEEFSCVPRASELRWVPG